MDKQIVEITLYVFMAVSVLLFSFYEIVTINGKTERVYHVERIN